MEKQIPDSSHYNAQYLGNKFQRLFSYRYQLEYITACSGTNVLVIGKGDGFIDEILHTMFSSVTIVDIAYDLKPDVCCSVVSLPFADNSFDVVLCSQVLEHLPFESFTIALHELNRVARKRVVISLPDNRVFVHFKFEIAWKVHIEKQISFNTIAPRLMPDDPEHYWEIGYKDYPLSRIIKEIRKAGLDIEQIKRVEDFSYHVFIVLTPRTHNHE